MNLYELDELIACLEVEKDVEMLAFYKRKRIKLINEINKELKDKGIPAKLKQKHL